MQLQSKQATADSSSCKWLMSCSEYLPDSHSRTWNTLKFLIIVTMHVNIWNNQQLLQHAHNSPVSYSRDSHPRVSFEGNAFTWLQMSFFVLQACLSIPFLWVKLESPLMLSSDFVHLSGLVHALITEGSHRRGFTSDGLRQGSSYIRNTSSLAPWLCISYFLLHTNQLSGSCIR